MSTDTIVAWPLDSDPAIRMETGGQLGRWNTLAGLRVLKWWDARGMIIVANRGE